MNVANYFTDVYSGMVPWSGPWRKGGEMKQCQRAGQAGEEVRMAL